MTSNGFDADVPKTRINMEVDLHTEDMQRRTECSIKAKDDCCDEDQRAVFKNDRVVIHELNVGSILVERSINGNWPVESIWTNDNFAVSISIAPKMHCSSCWRPEHAQ